jgi:hypothetical protein
VQINLRAPHLGFEMSMDYVMNNFMESFKNQAAKNEQDKQVTEAAKL